MDIKLENEIFIKEELLENVEDNKTSDHCLEQYSELKEDEKRNCYIKNEIAIKDEPFVIEVDCPTYEPLDIKVEGAANDHHHEQICESNKSLKRNCFSNCDVKSEIAIEDEEKDATKDELLGIKVEGEVNDQICGSDESQTIFDAGQLENDSEMENTLGSLPQNSVMHQEQVENNFRENSCDICCNYNFQCKDELKNHLKTHKKMLKCDICGYECNVNYKLKRHQLVHSNIKLFKCSECNYECNFIYKLKRHQLIHSNLKLFKCSDCNYESNRKEGLMKHMLSHGNIKLFKCTDCNFECNDKFNLKTHMLRHGNIKLFKCSECSYECNRKGSLLKHMLTHGDKKLLTCSECDYRCNDNSNLRRHMLKHGNIKLYNCAECSYGCNDQRYLKKHLLKHVITIEKLAKTSGEASRTGHYIGTECASYEGKPEHT